jgi:hypothetical protein
MLFGKMTLTDGSIGFVGVREIKVSKTDDINSISVTKLSADVFIGSFR